jgi:hypothetical protein
MKNTKSRFAVLLIAFVLCFGAVPNLHAAGLKVTVDTPFSFRASFTATDTDPYTLGGNDYQVFTLDYWTVLVNMRGDSVNLSGNASGFYEIQLRHTGSVIADATAPLVSTSLLYSNLLPTVVLTDSTVSSQPHQAGSEYLTTTVNIVFDPGAGATSFNGSIAGDSDLNGDGIIDSLSFDGVLQTLQGLKDLGIITGKEMGQIIKQTRQPIK